jgi:hypothetical protein
MEETITCCPRCKRPVDDAKEYMVNPIGSVMPQIECVCGYVGLPVEIKVKDYKRWAGDDANLKK